MTRGAARESPQHVDRRLQRQGLRFQLLSGSSTLLGVGGVALCDLIHLRHGHAHLPDALRLFLGRHRDLGHETVGGPDRADDLTKRFAQPPAARRPTAAIGNGGLDLSRRLLRRRGASLGQCPHLVGNDGEPGAGLTGPRRLDCCVERQDIRLESDFVDVLDDLGHLGTRHLDGPHRVVHIAHGGRARLRRVAGLVGERLGLVGVVGGAANHGRHLLQSRACLRHGRALFAATLSQRLAGRGELVRCQ